MDTVVECDLCNRILNDFTFSEESVTLGGSGFTFTFCNDCDKDYRPKCDDLIAKFIIEWQNKCKTHNEAIEKAKRKKK